MDEEKTAVEPGGEGPPSGNSTLKRVLALGAVAALLVIGVAVIPMFLAGRQAEINKDTRASNASYSAAAELIIKVPAKGLTGQELRSLTADSELLRNAEVEFDIPFDKENECAVLFFPSADVSVESDAGTLEKTALSGGILAVWKPEGASAGKLSVSEGAKKYDISLEKGEDDVFKAVVSALNNE